MSPKEMVYRIYLTPIVVDSTGRTVGDQIMKDLKDVGQITVKFHHVTNIRTSEVKGAAIEMTGLGDVPEKALKGRSLSHQSM
jgi:hypothetical protein